MMQLIKKKKKKKGGRGFFAGEVNFEFLILWIRDLLHSFRMTPHLSKLIKAFKFYNWKRIENSYCFPHFFSKRLNPYLRKPTAAKYLLFMCSISVAASQFWKVIIREFGIVFKFVPKRGQWFVGQGVRQGIKDVYCLQHYYDKYVVRNLTVLCCSLIFFFEYQKNPSIFL